MTRGEKYTAGMLGVLIVICFCIVTLGGYVRLSQSGLSIPEWPMFTVEVEQNAEGNFVSKEKALFPPTTDQGWESVREAYLYLVPSDHREYIANVPMDQFKTMFWIEWSHRGVAKGIGFLYLIFLGMVFAIPKVREKMMWKASVGLVLLVSQAVLGALVVFKHLPAEKIAIHLSVAFIFVSLLLWMLLQLVHPPVPKEERKGKNPMLPLSIGVYLIILLQIFSGGLMAGSLAGYQMNTWPLMGDYWVPPNMFIEDWGFAKNMLENKVVIQFTHRWFAFAALGAVLFLVLRSMTVKVSKQARWALRAVLSVCVIQVILGIITLLTGVHPHTALTHQSVGLVLLLTLLVVMYETATQPVLAEEALAELEENQTMSSSTKEPLTNA